MDQNITVTKTSCSFLNCLTQFLTIVGALNWGLIAAFNFDLVQALFGMSSLTHITYSIVGVAALIQALYFFKKIIK